MKKTALALLFAAGFLAAGSAHAAVPGVLFEWTDRVLIRDATGIARIIHKPAGVGVANAGNGWVTLQGGMKLSLPKSGSVPIELAKQVNRSQVVKFARPFARAFGPIAIASLALETIEWIDGKWQIYEKPDVPPTLGDKDNLFGCQLNGVGKSAYITINGSLYLVKVFEYVDRPMNTDWVSVANCMNPNYYQMDNGSWPQAWRLLIEEAPEPEDGEWRLASDSELESEIDDALSNNPNSAAPIVDFGFENGGTMDDLGGQQQEINAPDSVPGGTTETTKTTSEGNTTITEETTYNITTNNNTINITSTTNITTVHPDESVTEETREEKNPDPDPPYEPGEDAGHETKPGRGEEIPNLVDFCEKNPRASACAELGSSGDAVLGQETREITFDSEMNAAGSCPQPEQLSILGFQYDLSWQPVCDFATGIRPVVIAFTFLGAGLFLFQIGRSS